MSGVTLSIVNELTDLVQQKILAKRNSILEKFDVELKKLSQESYEKKTKTLKINQLLSEYEALTAEIATLETLKDKKESEHREIAEKVMQTMEHNDSKWVSFERWSRGEDRLSRMVTNLKDASKKEAVDAHHEVGPIVSELDELLEGVRERVLLANSNTALRNLVEQIIASIEKIAAE